MTIAELTLHSQAVHAYDGVDDLATTGPLWSGDCDQSVISATAIRFQLPADFDGSESISAATLNLSARTGPPNTSAGYGDHQSRIRVLASSSQVLPTTGSGVSSAAGGTEEKTIGEGTYTPALDHAVTSTYGAVAVDITAAMEEARAAGYLDGGYVVLLIQPVAYDEANYLEAQGDGHADKPTIDLNYSEASPPPDPIVVTPADAQVKCEGSLPAPFIDHWDATLQDAQVRVHAFEPQVSVVGQPSHAQVRTHATEPQVIAHWIVTPADAQVSTHATEPALSFDWVAAPADAQVLTQATLPRVYGPQRSRGLFPSDLFPTDLFE